MRYVAVIEQGPTSWGAFVPDLPVCVAVGATRQEVEQLIREAVQFHVESLLEHGDPIPVPGTWTVEVELDDTALQQAG